jgi:alpha-galactosidase
MKKLATLVTLLLLIALFVSSEIQLCQAAVRLPASPLRTDSWTGITEGRTFFETSSTDTVWLDELDLSPVKQGWRRPTIGKSVSGGPLEMHGKVYERGVGSSAYATILVELDGKAERFQAVVGIDDAAGKDDGPGIHGSVVIRVGGEKEWLYESHILTGGRDPVKLDIDISGLKRMVIILDDAGDGSRHDHVNLANAKFIVSGISPTVVGSFDFPDEEPIILTPPAPREPRINGPAIFGVRPGSPFIYRIPTSGDRPMHFSSKGLPAGLKLDAEKGIVTGVISSREEKTYEVTWIAENSQGRDESRFRIAVGQTLSLTPQMGWNHWYTHYNRVTEALMREAADVMVSSGMADVGYSYVNIDDCWMNAPEHFDEKRIGPLRDGDGNILSNYYFPDMKGMVDHIHSKGLKAGLYSSPGPLTCAGFSGSFEYEEQDAQLFATWEFDFLKYDWCSYRAKDNSLDEMKKPYIKMGDILKKQNRDIVLNICQYGRGDVWKWGREVGGHSWRTAGDLGYEISNYHKVARLNATYAEYAGPGAWNDPDYLLIGTVGNVHDERGEPKPCGLSPNQQYSYISLWSLMASPLFFTGLMSELDPFTLNLLCNTEVIAINQDALGDQGELVIERKGTEIWRKELEDGSMAIGMFNANRYWQEEVSFQWHELGLSGAQKLRDLWRQTDLGVFEEGYSLTLPRNGVLLLRIWPAEE